VSVTLTLPADPYSVIRVTWADPLGEISVLTKTATGHWVSLGGTTYREASLTSERIVNLEVLAQPFVLSPRELGWLVDAAEEGIGHLLDVVQEIESDPVPTEAELEQAVKFGVRADCGRRAIDKLGASYEPRVS
jgi:hypothetical protein